MLISFHADVTTTTIHMGMTKKIIVQPVQYTTKQTSMTCTKRCKPEKKIEANILMFWTHQIPSFAHSIQKKIEKKYFPLPTSPLIMYHVLPIK